MDKKDFLDASVVFSKTQKAGRRTYFFDVRSTRSDDYYITITESKKYTEEDGSFHFKKQKIFLYKEDFFDFKALLDEITSYVLERRGQGVIPRSQYEKEQFSAEKSSDFSFDDI